MEWLDRISFWVDKAVQSLMAIFLGLMTIFMLIQIIGRYFFNSGFVWTDEISRYLMVWMVFLGASVATRHWNHISVSVFEENSERMRKILPPIQKLLTFVYALVVIKVGIEIMGLIANQLSPNARISMAYIYAIFPVSCSLMAFHLIAQCKFNRNNKEKS